MTHPSPPARGANPAGAGGTPSVAAQLPTFRGASTAIGLAIPLAVHAIGMAIAFSWRGSLPDPVAIHWGTSGADGFSSLDASVYLMLGLGLAMALLFWGMAMALPPARKMLCTASVWLAVFLVGIELGGLSIQRGLDDAAQTGGIGGVMAVALGVSLVSAAVAFWLCPSDPKLPARKVDLQPSGEGTLSLADAEQVMWSQATRLGPGAWVAGASVLATMILPIIMQEPWMMAIPIGLILLLAALMMFRVTIDNSGIEARSIMGRPRLRIPLDEIQGARVTTTSPLIDFGGWGWRVNTQGYTGLVTRGGVSLTVERSGGRGLVVTVPDAETAAATLNGLLAREQRLASDV